MAEYSSLHKAEISMGPFPHDTPAADFKPITPCGTDGFEYCRISHPQPDALHALFS